MADIETLLRLLSAAGVGAMPSHQRQTPGLVEPGNIDLANRPKVKNPDGSISTVYSIGIVDKDPRSPRFGKEVLIPGVIPDRAGRYYTDFQGDAARRRYYESGQHLGVFDSSANSDAYGQRLHQDYEQGAYDRPGR